MARKRRSMKKRPPPRRRHKYTRQNDHENKTLSSWRLFDVSMDDLISFIYLNGGEAGLKELIKHFDLSRTQGKILQEELTQLCQQQNVYSCGAKRYRLNKKLFPSGVISVHPRGFGFVTLDELPPDGRDLFVAARHTNTALHTDRVLLQILKKRRGGRVEARVVHILKRGTTHLVGTYVAGRTGMVIPQDPHFPFHILIRREQSCGAKNGEAVVAELGELRPNQRNVSGRIIEVLGDPSSTKVQMEMVIRQFKLPREFDETTLQETEKISARVDVSSDREDLREIPHVTIDGETARDFDDGVAVIKTKKGFRLYVSIADVSHYVTPGSALDRDAYLRGTSVYFPTGVLPMLPERLSNHLCSLNPDEDRYAFTAILDFDPEGSRLNQRFCKSVIISKARLTYTQVKQIVVDQDPQACAQYSELLTQLKWMAELGRLLEKKRMARGSIGFDMPEAGVEIGPDGRIGNIIRRERNQAHKIIEEFMLAANEAVAETFARHDFPAIYRIHEKPDEIKVAEFVHFLQTLGFELPTETISPGWFNKILTFTKGTKHEYIANNLLLRTMKQARYSPDNVGHFGLAASCYTHFTSPIRRYPDLMVHRALAALISRSQPPEGIALNEAGEFLSKRERAATEAEWALLDRLKVLYMADKVGQSFKGMVSGVTSFGIFIELSNIFVNGAVSMSDLKGDYYHFDEKNYRLLGEHTGSIFQIGDEIRVKLVKADMQLYRLEFVVDEE
ncbi:MAG: ribonuclease R [Thermodesulfobacteriota bacterium]|nr:ribonuclease R [Thermodesulfobacteriota bacterium]